MPCKRDRKAEDISQGEKKNRARGKRKKIRTKTERKGKKKLRKKEES